MNHRTLTIEKQLEINYIIVILLRIMNMVEAVMKYRNIYILPFVLSIMFVNGVVQASTVVFPPENIADCKPGTALTWDGVYGHGVRCTDTMTPSGTAYYAITCRSAAGRTKTFLSYPIHISNETAADAGKVWLQTDAPTGLSTWLIQIKESDGQPVKALNCYETGATNPPTFWGNPDCMQYGVDTGLSLNGTGRLLAACSPAYIVAGKIPGTP